MVPKEEGEVLGKRAKNFPGEQSKVCQKWRWPSIIALIGLKNLPEILAVYLRMNYTELGPQPK